MHGWVHGPAVWWSARVVTENESDKEQVESREAAMLPLDLDRDVAMEVKKKHPVSPLELEMRQRISTLFSLPVSQ